MSYTCPVCGMTSHHPEDERNRYCGRCHRFEDEGEGVVIHRCSNCGRWEGERPQAGCCPGCGAASDPVPHLVRVIHKNP